MRALQFAKEVLWRTHMGKRKLGLYRQHPTDLMPCAPRDCLIPTTLSLSLPFRKFWSTQLTIAVCQFTRCSSLSQPQPGVKSSRYCAMTSAPMGPVIEHYQIFSALQSAHAQIQGRLGSSSCRASLSSGIWRSTADYSSSMRVILDDGRTSEV